MTRSAFYWRDLLVNKPVYKPKSRTKRSEQEVAELSRKVKELRDKGRSWDAISNSLSIGKTYARELYERTIWGTQKNR